MATTVVQLDNSLQQNREAQKAATERQQQQIVAQQAAQQIEQYGALGLATLNPSMLQGYAKAIGNPNMFNGLIWQAATLRNMNNEINKVEAQGGDATPLRQQMQDTFQKLGASSGMSPQQLRNFATLHLPGQDTVVEQPQAQAVPQISAAPAGGQEATPVSYTPNFARQPGPIPITPQPTPPVAKPARPTASLDMGILDRLNSGLLTGNPNQAQTGLWENRMQVSEQNRPQVVQELQQAQAQLADIRANPGVAQADPSIVSTLEQRIKILSEGLTAASGASQMAQQGATAPAASTAPLSLEQVAARHLDWQQRKNTLEADLQKAKNAKSPADIKRAQDALSKLGPEPSRTTSPTAPTVEKPVAAKSTVPTPSGWKLDQEQQSLYGKEIESFGKAAVDTVLGGKITFNRGKDGIWSATPASAGGVTDESALKYANKIVEDLNRGDYPKLIGDGLVNYMKAKGLGEKPTPGAERAADAAFRADINQAASPQVTTSPTGKKVTTSWRKGDAYWQSTKNSYTRFEDAAKLAQSSDPAERGNALATIQSLYPGALAGVLSTLETVSKADLANSQTEMNRLKVMVDTISDQLPPDMRETLNKQRLANNALADQIVKSNGVEGNYAEQVAVAKLALMRAQTASLLAQTKSAGADGTAVALKIKELGLDMYKQFSNDLEKAQNDKEKADIIEARNYVAKNYLGGVGQVENTFTQGLLQKVSSGLSSWFGGNKAVPQGVTAAASTLTPAERKAILDRQLSGKQ